MRTQTAVVMSSIAVPISIVGLVGHTMSGDPAGIVFGIVSFVFCTGVAAIHRRRARRERDAMFGRLLLKSLLIAMLVSCVPARTARTYAPDVQWCREVEQRQWTYGAATQGLGALSGGLGLIAATQEADTALWLSLSGAVLAAAGVTTAHLGQSHATAYAEQCGPQGTK